MKRELYIALVMDFMEMKKTEAEKLVDKALEKRNKAYGNEVRDLRTQ